MMRRFAAAAAAVAAATVCSAGLTGAGLTGTGAALAAPRTSAAAHPAAAAEGHWWKAEKVPGIAALSHGPAGLATVSCAAVGTCSGGGFYTSSAGYSLPYVVDEEKGVWGTAREVPGVAALNKGGQAGLDDVSCASAGNCTAVGTYTTKPYYDQLFVVSETNGTWGTAQKLPGLAALNTGGDVYGGVSCGAPGNCGMVGSYTELSGADQAFVATQTNGIWGKAEDVPGLAALNQGGDVEVGPLSCGAAGTCTAAGDYTDSDYNQQEFIVNETNGIWGKAEKFPGLAALKAEPSPEVTNLSCTSAGDCSADGWYLALNPHGSREVFVTTETNGVWGNAEEVPGLGALNTDGGAYLEALSCASAGNCTAGGFYTAGVCSSPGCVEDPVWPLVVTETNGTWGTAQKLPGIKALNKGQVAQVGSLSCAAAGDCSAVGYYTDGSSDDCCTQTYVDTQTNGTWGTAEETPGLAALNHGNSDFYGGVSCGAPGRCSAGGDYTDSSGDNQPFVVRESPAS